MTTLKDKTAVVTGSTSGISLACARAFAGAGANVMLNRIGAPADVERSAVASARSEKLSQFLTQVNTRSRSSEMMPVG
jgi:NAD(P)-dependent dehydrogenase (short-subunit alcohol dehydrogenase family)